MFIGSNPQFVYVSFTKCGSRTAYSTLTSNFPGIRTNRTWQKIPSQYENYPSFCIARNPYARMVSWWWSICMTPGDRYGHKKELATMGQPETLTGFLRLWETKKTQSQHHRVEANGGFDHILKLESLEEDFNALPFVTKHISIPKPQKKNYPHWSKLIDAEAGQLINDIYAKDFEYFGYEMLEF